MYIIQNSNLKASRFNFDENTSRFSIKASVKKNILSRILKNYNKHNLDKLIIKGKNYFWFYFVKKN